MKHTYAVIGLGVFGSTIALELSRLGNEVIGIDLNPSLVSEIADRITQAVIADARDERSDLVGRGRRRSRHRRRH